MLFRLSKIIIWLLAADMAVSQTVFSSEGNAYLRPVSFSEKSATHAQDALPYKMTTHWFSALWVAFQCAPDIKSGKIASILDIGPANSGMPPALKELGIDNPPVVNVGAGADDLRALSVIKDNSFGLATAIFNLHDLSKNDLILTLVKANRLLKDNAEFIITFPVAYEITSAILTDIHYAGFEVREDAVSNVTSHGVEAMEGIERQYGKNARLKLEKLIRDRFRVIILRKTHHIPPQERQAAISALKGIGTFYISKNTANGQPVPQPPSQTLNEFIQRRGGIGKELVKPRDLERVYIKPHTNFHKQIDFFNEHPLALFLLPKENAHFMLGLIAKNNNNNKDFLEIDIRRFHAILSSFANEKDKNGLDGFRNAVKTLTEKNLMQDTVKELIAMPGLVQALTLMRDEKAAATHLFANANDRAYALGQLHKNTYPEDVLIAVRNRYSLMYRLSLSGKDRSDAVMEAIKNFIAEQAPSIEDKTLRQDIVLRLIDMEDSDNPAMQGLGEDISGALKELKWDEFHLLALALLKKGESSRIQLLPFTATTVDNRGRIYIGNIRESVLLSSGIEKEGVKVTVIPANDYCGNRILKVFVKGNKLGDDNLSSRSRFDYENQVLKTDLFPEGRPIIDILSGKNAIPVKFTATTEANGRIYIGALNEKPLFFPSGTGKSGVKFTAIPEKTSDDKWIYKVFHDGNPAENNNPDTYVKFDCKNQELVSPHKENTLKNHKPHAISGASQLEPLKTNCPEAISSQV